MKYFFVLGNNPTLSMAEICSVFSDAQRRLMGENILVLESAHAIDPAFTIKRLGGTIKIGRLTEEISPSGWRQIANLVLPMLKNKKVNGKLKFGLSYYGRAGKVNVKAIGMELKERLSEQGINSRWVTSRQPALSSVVVEQNKLISLGAEIILTQNNGKLLIGLTQAVQPFKELSWRDYGRPARDDRSGMLPPKLARMMINLARVKPDGTILDPFCGSGTILTEAVLMGYGSLIGADVSVKAVEDTRKNLEWTRNGYQLSVISYQLFNASVQQLFNFVKGATINAIITEPYLGPQRGRFDFHKVRRELEKLYSESLVVFEKILKSDGRVVMIWPVFRQGQKQIFINPNLNGFKIKSLIPRELENNPVIKLTPRKTIVYGRPEQKVWREVVVMERK